jgi:dCTP deaminase
MTLLNDRQIIEENKKMRKQGSKGMIEGFVPRQIRSRGEKNIISYGLSSFGYDIRLDKFIYTPALPDVRTLQILDPKSGGSMVNQDKMWDTRVIDKNGYEIPPHGFVLANSVERFNIPEDILAVCVGKSTYARCGLVVNVTPLEPGWNGFLTLEISNTTNFNVKIYANEGIAQLLFYKGERPLTTYADRAGKYQDQTNRPVLPRM